MSRAWAHVLESVGGKFVSLIGHGVHDAKGQHYHIQIPQLAGTRTNCDT